MRAKVELTPLKVKLDKLSSAASKDFLEAAAQKVYNKAMDGANGVPVGLTGELKNSLDFGATETEGWVGTNLEYAIYVHQGTGIYANGGKGRLPTAEHPIPWAWPATEAEVEAYGKDKNVSYAKNGQAFIWTYGQEPNPFLTRALEESTTEI